MHDLELLQRLAAALAIGLLIGVERGWSMREEPEGERSIGLRTLALTGLLGGVCGAIALRLDGGAIVLAMAFLAYALVIAFLRYREMSTTRRSARPPSSPPTRLCAGDAWPSSASPGPPPRPVLPPPASSRSKSRCTAGSEAPHLERAARRPRPARHDADPLAGAARSWLSARSAPSIPYELWLMTILIAAVSSAGYVGMKWFGGTPGCRALRHGRRPRLLDGGDAVLLAPGHARTPRAARACRRHAARGRDDDAPHPLRRRRDQPRNAAVARSCPCACRVSGRAVSPPGTFWRSARRRKRRPARSQGAVRARDRAQVRRLPRRHHDCRQGR